MSMSTPFQLDATSGQQEGISMSGTMTAELSKADSQASNSGAGPVAKRSGRPDTLHSSFRKGEQREYRFIYAIAFLFFLAIVIVARLFPRSMRPDPIGTGQYKTIFGEARAITNMTIPYAFMG
jgi:hypothetical protein